MGKENDIQEIVTELGQELTRVTMKYADLLEPYEIVLRLISEGVHIALDCAPNYLVGFKTIQKSIEIGIVEFQEIVEE